MRIHSLHHQIVNDSSASGRNNGQLGNSHSLFHNRSPVNSLFNVSSTTLSSYSVSDLSGSQTPVSPSPFVQDLSNPISPDEIAQLSSGLPFSDDLISPPELTDSNCSSEMTSPLVPVVVQSDRVAFIASLELLNNQYIKAQMGSEIRILCEGVKELLAESNVLKREVKKRVNAFNDSIEKFLNAFKSKETDIHTLSTLLVDAKKAFLSLNFSVKKDRSNSDEIASSFCPR